MKIKYRSDYKRLFERALMVCRGLESTDSLKKERLEYIEKYGIDQSLLFQRAERRPAEVYASLLPKWTKKAASFGTDAKKYADVAQFCYENWAWHRVQSVMRMVEKVMGARQKSNDGSPAKIK